MLQIKAKNDLGFLLELTGRLVEAFCSACHDCFVLHSVRALLEADIGSLHSMVRESQARCRRSRKRLAILSECATDCRQNG
jgi:hypothetical protein